MTRLDERSAAQQQVNTLLDYIRIPSVSTTGEGIERGVDFLVALMRDLGFQPRVFEMAGDHPIVYAEAGPANAPFTLLVYGHYDVFPAEGQTGWRTEPFAPVVEGDRIWGRGAGDNKGQHLAWLFGLASHLNKGMATGIRVKLVIEGSEETGSKGLATFVQSNREMLRADLCCYSDGPMFPNDQPVLLLGVRGILCMEFRARGAARSLHSGNFGGIAPTPVLDLVRCLAALFDEHGRLRIPGTVPSEASLIKDREALALLPLDWNEVKATLGCEPVVTDDSSVAYYENLMCRPNLNVSGIRAGYTDAGIKTIIPNEVIAKADIRLVGDQDPDQIFAAVGEFIVREGFRNVEVRKLVGQPPSKTALDHPLVDRVRAAVATGFGRTPLLVPSLGGTTPDYLFTKVLGMPSVVVPLAPYDENNHAENESTKVSTFLSGIAFVRELVNVLAQTSRAADSYARSLA